MSPPETLALNIGGSRSLRLLHDSFCLLAAAALVMSQAQPRIVGWSLVTLAIAWVVSRWHLMRASLNGRLQLRCDGAATLFERTGSSEMYLHASWLCPWFCVLRLRDVTSDDDCRALVCRSRNDVDSWRHLRVRLRTGQGSGGGRKW